VIITDATNVLRAGDLVSVAPDRSVLVTECKATRSTARSARANRQANRADQIARYLRSGIASDPTFGIRDLPFHGPVDEPLITLDVGPEVTRDVTALQATIQRADLNGFASTICGTKEMVIVRSGTSSFPDSMEMIRPLHEGDALLIGNSFDLINQASALYPPVTLWDVPLETRLRLWEKDLVVAHLVATSAFVGPHTSDSSMEIVDCDCDRRLLVRFDGGEAWIGPSVVESVLYTWETPESARARALSMAMALLNSADPNDLASGGLETRFEIFVPEPAGA
jgi:hypothetical protein